MPTTLKIIEGPGKGTEFPVLVGDTIIGRGAKAQIKLASPEVSWEHAVISRMGEDWMIENLSAHGTQVNDTKISGRVRLRPRDRIRVADDTLLRFESTDGPQANALSNPWVVRSLAAMVVLIILAWVAVIALRKPATAANWNNGHARLLEWVRGEVAANRMLQDVSLRFSDARNKELNASAAPNASEQSMANYRLAAARYQDLMLMIDAMEEKYHCIRNAANNPRALNDVMELPPDAPLLDAEKMSAAFYQFVRNRLNLCNASAGVGK